MSVHEWVVSFRFGESRPIPKNCRAEELIHYAKRLFDVKLIQEGENLRRVCPCCYR